MAREYQGDSVCKCGKDLPVYKTGGGMLTASCGWCRLQIHCPQGSKSYRDLQATIKGGVNPDIEPKKEEPPKQAKKQVEPKEEKTIFDFLTAGAKA